MIERKETRMNKSHFQVNDNEMENVIQAQIKRESSVNQVWLSYGNIYEKDQNESIS